MLTKKDPPPTHQRRSGTDWEGAVAHMRKHPGVWYEFGEWSPGMASHIRRGVYKQFLPADFEGDPRVYMRQHWEVASRGTERAPRRIVDLFIRFLG